MIKELDISISVLNILGIVAIALWVGLKKNTVAKGDVSVDYFLWKIASLKITAWIK